MRTLFVDKQNDKVPECDHNNKHQIYFTTKRMKLIRVELLGWFLGFLM